MKRRLALVWLISPTITPVVEPVLLVRESGDERRIEEAIGTSIWLRQYSMNIVCLSIS
jgi:hypothetical protein